MNPILAAYLFLVSFFYVFIFVVVLIYIYLYCNLELILFLIFFFFVFLFTLGYKCSTAKHTKVKRYGVLASDLSALFRCLFTVFIIIIP